MAPLDDEPIAWCPRGVSGELVAGAGGVLGPVPFRIPADKRIVGLYVGTSSGSPADAAGLNIRIQDENANDVIDDTFGTSFEVPALALVGLNLGRPYALSRVVRAGQVWNFTLTNDNAGDVLAHVVLYVEDL